MAPDDRVLLAHRGRPVPAKPDFLAGREGQELPHVRIGEVQLREALEGAVQGEHDGADVGELVGQGGDRRREEADGLLDIVAQIDEMLARAAINLPEQAAELGLRELMHRPPDARQAAPRLGPSPRLVSAWYAAYHRAAL